MKLKLHFLNSLPCVRGFACMLWLMNAISYGNRKQLRISTKIPFFFSLLKHSVYNIFYTIIKCPCKQFSYRFGVAK